MTMTQYKTDQEGDIIMIICEEHEHNDKDAQNANKDDDVMMADEENWQTGLADIYENFNILNID